MTVNIICYAIVLKDTNELLSAETMRKAYPNYGGMGLYGWKPPKKVYYKVGHAKSAYTMLPERIRELCTIVPLGVAGEPLDVEKVVEEAKKRKAKKEEAHAVYTAKIKAENAERQLAAARATLAKYGVDK